MNDLVFLDTETTGLDFDTSQVVELAYAVGWGEIKTLVPPHTLQGADPVALRINKYYERGLDDRSRWASEIELMMAKAVMTNRTIVAANPRFDSRMLERTFGFRGNNEPWKFRLFDLQSFAAGILELQEPISMAKLYELVVFEDPDTPRPDHTAAGDVATMRYVFAHLREQQAELRDIAAEYAMSQGQFKRAVD